jgi:orotidine-5'-phosphate decarboxylase
MVRAVPAPARSHHFGDALILRSRELGHPLCVGIDPHLGSIPPLFRRGAMTPRDPSTADAVEAFCCEIVDRVAGRVAVVKPQIAFFEQLGWAGMRALGNVMSRARAAGLLVLLDAKRGDIGSTAEGYANAFLGESAPLEADAITLNPYMGLDTLEPFALAAERARAGMFVLAKTSNAGSGDLQDLKVDGAPIYERVAESLAPLAKRLAGPQTGWSSLGVVVGATWPEQHDAVRKHLPTALFLVPGYGAQGGGAVDSVRGFTPGPNGLEGGVVSSSRGILFPAGGDTNDANAWETAVDEALERAIGELGDAVRAS